MESIRLDSGYLVKMKIFKRQSKIYKKTDSNITSLNSLVDVPLNLK